MRFKVQQFAVPPEESIIIKGVNGKIDYLDCFSIAFKHSGDFSIDYLTALLFSTPIPWADVLLKFRNFLVRPFGLKTDLPKKQKMDPSVYFNIGEVAGLFHVVDRSDSEIVMAENDRHLFFKTSLRFIRANTSDEQIVYLTTLVQFHNATGRIYFAVVKPFHQLIMKSTLKRFAASMGTR